MRRILIAGNWKMNKTPTQAQQLADELKSALVDMNQADLLVCPPYVALDRVRGVLAGSNVQVGAQDLHWEDQGAFTGKVSAEMLRDIGVTHAIIGHSEQRQYFHESDETVNKKVHKALTSNLIPIICVGETLEEREGGQLETVVKRQTEGAFQGVSQGDAAKCVVAYEPVWAIGTGKTATPDQAQDMHKFIRGLLGDLYGTELAEKVQILYGGSMKPDNAGDLLSRPDIDGGLIGGASLKAGDFTAIAQAVK